MKRMGMLLVMVGGSVLASSLVFANPAMLPKHKGYPAGGKSPVTGQATANDPGQANADGAKVLSSGAMSHDKAAMNEVSDPNRMRIKKSVGAGRLPEVEGPLNKVNINPAKATSTKMGK